MGGYKNQLTGKYEKKFKFLTFLTLKFIAYIRKFTAVNILGYVSY